jgi:DNA-binding response OmpR family regulator
MDRVVVAQNPLHCGETMPAKPIILVIDDDLPILLLMRSLLREFGFEAVTAESGQQALIEARKVRPSVVLVDRNMPGMNGEDVIRALRNEPGFERLPILILSGQPVTKSDLAAIGADGAVMKPFDIAELIAQLRSLAEAGQHA